MNEKMSRWGVGPVFASLSIGYGITMLAISRYYFPAFLIIYMPYGVLLTLGIILLLIGIPFFIASVVAVTKAYNADRLVTNGIFRCCRHPSVRPCESEGPCLQDQEDHSHTYAQEY
ncbi:MAG: hypothetical protein JW944_08120 [Deltaproteobacteria bacterium]|nr:hypothetical protein [Deltaproteobacteria bacterium]